MRVNAVTPRGQREEALIAMLSLMLAGVEWAHERALLTPELINMARKVAGLRGLATAIHERHVALLVRMISVATQDMAGTLLLRMGETGPVVEHLPAAQPAGEA